MDPAGAKLLGATDTASAEKSLVDGTYSKTLKIVMARGGESSPTRAGERACGSRRGVGRVFFFFITLEPRVG